MAVVQQARGAFGSTPKLCAISDCRARLLGMSYIVVTLDDGRVLALCRPCYREVQRKTKERAGR